MFTLVDAQMPDEVLLASSFLPQIWFFLNMFPDDSMQEGKTSKWRRAENVYHFQIMARNRKKNVDIFSLNETATSARCVSYRT